jgi:hypothetical protein
MTREHSGLWRPFQVVKNIYIFQVHRENKKAVYNVTTRLYTL